MKPAPILNPAFKWTPAADHLTPAGLDAFRARMKAYARAQVTNVKPIQRRKA